MLYASDSNSYDLLVPIMRKKLERKFYMRLFSPSKVAILYIMLHN